MGRRGQPATQNTDGSASLTVNRAPRVTWIGLCKPDPFGTGSFLDRVHEFDSCRGHCNVRVSHDALRGHVCDDGVVGPTVLIVDDHDVFRASARALLESEGFVVVGEAASGGEALDVPEPASSTRLESCGPVSRSINPQGRRSVVVTLTASDDVAASRVRKELSASSGGSPPSPPPPPGRIRRRHRGHQTRHPTDKDLNLDISAAARLESRRRTGWSPGELEAEG